MLLKTMSAKCKRCTPQADFGQRQTLRAKSTIFK